MTHEQWRDVVSCSLHNKSIAGVVPWEIAVPNQAVERVDFAVDGTGLASAVQAPYLFDLGAGGLDTTKLPDGPHTLAVKATFTGGGWRSPLAVHRRQRTGLPAPARPLPPPCRS